MNRKELLKAKSRDAVGPGHLRGRVTNPRVRASSEKTGCLESSVARRHRTGECGDDPEVLDPALNRPMPKTKKLDGPKGPSEGSIVMGVVWEVVGNSPG